MKLFKYLAHRPSGQLRFEIPTSKRLRLFDFLQQRPARKRAGITVVPVRGDTKLQRVFDLNGASQALKLLNEGKIIGRAVIVP